MLTTNCPLVQLFTSVFTLLAVIYCFTDKIDFIIAQPWQQVTNGNNNNNNDDPTTSTEFLNCGGITDKINKLSDDCMILRYFNRTYLDSLPVNEADKLVEHCACQLTYMEHLWIDSFDDKYGETQRLYNMVKGTLVKYEKELLEKGDKVVSTMETYPKYLWSDIEVTSNGLSIYIATKDYYQKRRSDPSLQLGKELRTKLRTYEAYRYIESTCTQLIKDPHKLYRYMENLIRANKDIFYKLLYTTEIIDIAYQSSKACKFLLTFHMDKYKLKPDNPDFVPVDDINLLPIGTFNDLKQSAAATSTGPTNNNLNLKNPFDDIGNEMDENNVDDEAPTNIDYLFKDSSALLLNCSSWQKNRSSVMELEQNCPMMMMEDEKVPKEWIVNHPSIGDRSRVAIQCGCQLLLHNSTWNEMMQDSNIQIMSNAITNYMIQNRIADFMETPVWSIYGWFNEIMDKFKNNRQLAIKEIVKAKRGKQDPVEMINRSTGDSVEALELLRRGCNYIMLDYNGSEAESEIKLITYLGNLQLISQDPMFVFHLTLQDPNLFKLHALSKMCLPIIYNK